LVINTPIITRRSFAHVIIMFTTSLATPCRQHHHRHAPTRNHAHATNKHAITTITTAFSWPPLSRITTLAMFVAFTPRRFVASSMVGINNAVSTPSSSPPSLVNGQSTGHAVTLSH